MQSHRELIFNSKNNNKDQLKQLYRNQRSNSFFVNEVTFLSVTGSPIFFATISKDSLTMVWAAFAISSGKIISPEQIPLQFLTASGFKPTKILFVLLS